MGYNQGLAVGLAVGLPCFIVLVGVLFFLRRNRRKIREEDLHDTALDVEMGENGSFKEFGEALHRPAEQIHDESGENSETSAQKSPQKSVSNNETTVAAKSLSISTESASNSSKTQSSPGRTYSSHQNGQNGRSPGRNTSAYDFYDTVIPIMPPDLQNEPNLAQPPSLGANTTTPDRHSLHSSRGSLLQGDNSTRSLENLAKQLQGPQFFEKVPSRAGTTMGKYHPRRPAQNSSKNSSMTDLGAPFENGGINDHFVSDRSVFYTPENASNIQPSVSQSQSQSPQPTVPHPYRERANGQKEGAYNNDGMGLENNFDNEITADTHFAPAADVVFK